MSGSKKMTVFLLMALLFALVCCLSACGGGGTGDDDTDEGYSLDITDQVSEWSKATKNDVTYYYAEQVVYCTNPSVKSKQCLNIYVPEEYMEADGTLNEQGSAGSYTCETAPILYINSVGAYLGKAPYKISESTETTAGANGWYYEYLKEGYVLVFAGALGRADYDKENGNVSTGKAPVGLACLKAGLRFLRYNEENLPGDLDKIISNGMSAGGAMSTLIAVSGNSTEFDSYLEEMGAAMDQTDDVYAAQIYCPITDLEHADFAYEWYYQSDTSSSYYTKLTDFEKELSSLFADSYVSYFNGLGITVDGTAYTIDEGGTTGTFTDWIMEQYEAAYENEYGTSKSFTSVEQVISACTGRSKSCPSFDTLEKDSSECSVFGSRSSTLTGDDFTRHFSVPVTEVIATLADSYPDEYAEYYESYLSDTSLEDTQEAVALYSPYTYLSAGTTDVAEKIRICVGTSDSDTAPAISACLALMLQSLGIDTEYNMVWGLGHTDADTEGAFEAWVNSIS